VEMVLTWALMTFAQAKIRSRKFNFVFINFLCG